jgi:hypothetical protein
MMTTTRLNADEFKHYVDAFNADDQEDIVNLIPNAGAWEWMTQNVPLFTCSDKDIERIYYYRWWTFRKHIKQTPAGIIVTEFIEPVRHAGTYNSISCALGHHLAEGRWIRDTRILDEYTRFWFRGGENGGPEYRFHRYSQWTAAAMLDRYRVTGDASLLLELLPDLMTDYANWEEEKRRDDGLFWQFDVWDGMEESISGSRKRKNARPTINSYMYANALAIADIADIAAMAGKSAIAENFRAKAAELQRLVQEKLWDAEARFFKAQTEEGPLSDAREAIGFIPWCFDLPDRGHEDAWRQLVDEQGFRAPCGLTTAERRHPRFRSHGVGKCEWDGAVWPFAISQTLNALANVLRHYDQAYVTKQHYLDAVRTYARSHQKNGKPYIGEYHDEKTGEWLKGDNPRSRYYNHSTFCDLVIAGLVGLVPRSDRTIEVSPLLPPDAWNDFCLDNVPYHGRSLTIAWRRGDGLTILVDGHRVAHSPTLARMTAELP